MTCLALVLGVILALILAILYGKQLFERYDSVEADLAQARALQQIPLPSSDSLADSGATYMQEEGIQPSNTAFPSLDPFYEQNNDPNWEIGVV